MKSVLEKSISTRIALGIAAVLGTAMAAIGGAFLAGAAKLSLRVACWGALTIWAWRARRKPTFAEAT